jgi:hypothetical protein
VVETDHTGATVVGTVCPSVCLYVTSGDFFVVAIVVKVLCSEDGTLVVPKELISLTSVGISDGILKVATLDVSVDGVSGVNLERGVNGTLVSDAGLASVVWVTTISVRCSVEES